MFVHVYDILSVGLERNSKWHTTADGTSSCARRLFPTEPGQKKVKKKQSSQPQQDYHYYDEDAQAAHGTGVATWEYQC